MTIVKNKVATFEYTLTDNKGTVVDTSSNHGPLSYIQGCGNIIPGLEAAMEGKKAGDSFKVSIEPKDAYGEKRDDMIVTVTKDKFDPADPVEVGMQFQIQTPEGLQVVTITHIDQDHVTLDANHPLSGETLHFDVKITEVRDASLEELKHGHVHAGSCCSESSGCGDCGGHC